MSNPELPLDAAQLRASSLAGGTQEMLFSDDLTALEAQMTERRIRHVPVVGDGGLVAIVSIGDVVKHRIRDLAAERDQLEAYITQ